MLWITWRPWVTLLSTNLKVEATRRISSTGATVDGISYKLVYDDTQAADGRECRTIGICGLILCYLTQITSLKACRSLQRVWAHAVSVFMTLGCEVISAFSSS